MTTFTIDDDWLPTADRINALPMPLRVYIHELETHWDPAYTLQQLAMARDQLAELQAAIVLAKVFRKL